jgi:hypothetical protein
MHKRRDHSTRRPNYEAQPTGEKTKATQRRDRAEPFYICKGEEIKAPAEDHNPGGEQARCGPARDRLRCEHEKNDGVDEVIQNGGFPNGGCAVNLERSSQSMRAERAQHNREETERAREAKSGDVHNRKLE